jgi:hypothetical protein
MRLRSTLHIYVTVWCQLGGCIARPWLHLYTLNLYIYCADVMYVIQVNNNQKDFEGAHCLNSTATTKRRWKLSCRYASVKTMIHTIYPQDRIFILLLCISYRANPIETTNVGQR